MNAGLFEHLKTNQYNSILWQNKEENVIILINAEKGYDKIQNPFTIETLSKLRIEEKFAIQ